MRSNGTDWSHEHEAAARSRPAKRKEHREHHKPGWKGSEQTAAALEAHVKGQLAPDKYPPWFEWREALPKSDRGKVAREELKREV